MAIPQSSSKYTDEIYVTKKDLVNLLHTSLVDSLFDGIRFYRKANSKLVSLKTLNQNQFSITCTAALDLKFKSLGLKIASFEEEARKFAKYGDEFERFKRHCVFKSLQGASLIEEKRISEATLKAMTSSFYTGFDEEHISILGYQKALLSNIGEPNEDYLAEVMCEVNGEEELTSFYRFDDPSNSVSLVDRIYEYAPSERIPELMDDLFSYLSSDKSDKSIKSIVASYYLYYIKPFQDHNGLLASMFAKSILNSFGLKYAYLLPIEEAFVPCERLKAINLEIQKYSDLTYFLLYAIEKINASIDEMLDEISKAKGKALLEERNFVEEEPIEEPLPQEEEEAEPPGDLNENIDIDSLELPSADEIKSQPIPKIEIEEMDSTDEGSALPKIKSNSLSEKEIRDAAKYLLEIHPDLRKAQAHFYAGHCTIGRYYTIADFKRCARCAYETARTSMDGLAAKGFYKKLAVKNKFVYTPLRQEGEN